MIREFDPFLLVLLSLLPTCQKLQRPLAQSEKHGKMKKQGKTEEAWFDYIPEDKQDLKEEEAEDDDDDDDDE